jgi:hypothetical protein
MGNEEKVKSQLSDKELKKLRDELWVVIPFFVAALVFFLGSFQFRKEAADVPMVIGAITTLLVGMRLYHIIFPHSKIGEFKEAGLAGEFDHIKETIEEETLKGHYEGPKGKEITFADERKAFIGIIGCFVLFLLFGYILGCMIAIVFCSYYYGYKEKLPLTIVVLSLFIIVYVVLYKLLEAPEDFGLLLTPILEKLELIS